MHAPPPSEAALLVPPSTAGRAAHASRASPPPRAAPPAATFVFQNPAIFEASSELGDITGLYMVDDEGTIQVRVLVTVHVGGAWRL